MTGNVIACDIGVGDAIYAGLEEFLFHTNPSEQVTDIFGGIGRFTTIPSGTTLQLRGQNSSATAEAFDACIYGVY